MGEWDERNVHNLIQILRCFYMVSGLKINLSKSNLLGVGMVFPKVISMDSITGCSPAAFPFSYLGAPVGGSMVRVKSWDVIIDRFRKRLSSWRIKLLYISGRLTLIKYVFGSLGIYYFSPFQSSCYCL